MLCDLYLACLLFIVLQMSSSMRDKSLDAISDSLIEAGDFLRMIQGDRKKLECLRVFASSLKVVEWIRQETRGIQLFDLRNSVSKISSPIQVSMISTTL